MLKLLYNVNLLSCGRVQQFLSFSKEGKEGQRLNVGVFTWRSTNHVAAASTRKPDQQWLLP
jgi:hypothetical protein